MAQLYGYYPDVIASGGYVHVQFARWFACCGLCLFACDTAKSGDPDAAVGSGQDAGPRDSAAQAAGKSAGSRAGSGGTNTKFTGNAGGTASACMDWMSAQTFRPSHTDVEMVDLLFMVDNSNSMAGEQRALAQQFPNMIKLLTTGRRSDSDPDPLPAVKSLHVGIVSSDMGIPGVDFPSGNCHADGGDDGRLQHTPRGANCDVMYPTFLSFNADPKVGVVTDVTKFGSDVACISYLGTGGCGFEEQLEAPFKALWPKTQIDVLGNVVVSNRYRFLSVTEEGTWGRGDVPSAQGGNAGFLRSDPQMGPSLIAIVVVTDEEDCSVKSTEHLKPNNQLSQDSPYRTQDINLRCFLNKEFLYDIKDRYYDGFRALRPGREDLVVFTAIAGIPPELVSSEALAQVNFDSNDPSTRNAFYDAILNDPRMQETPDPSTDPGSGKGNIKPSCIRTAAGENLPATAFPPRRIVQLAKLFDKSGMVQSICQDDLGPAMSSIGRTITQARHREEKYCLKESRARDASGKIACDLIWQLPAASSEGAELTACDQRAYLQPLEKARVPADAVGQYCKVRQLAESDVSQADGGWYYTESTQAAQRDCPGQRIAFSGNVQAPADVTVRLECKAELACRP